MVVDPAWIDASGGAPAYSSQELRLTTITPMFAGAGASLGVRSGVRPSGSGTDLLVQAQASPNMTVKVNPGVFVAQGSISTTQGAYAWALDAVTNVTIAAAHATLARVDLIVVRIRDAGVDTSGQRDGAVTVVTGTAGAGVPALPTDASYFEIARIAVAATDTTIGSGDITDKRAFTASVGGVIACNSTTEPTATAVAPGQPVYRTDLSSGSRRRYSDATNWQTAPGGIGGNRWTGGGNLVTNLTTTELVIMSTPTLTLPPNTVCVIKASIYIVASVATGGVWLFRIRDTNVSGTQRANWLWYAPTTGQGYQQQFEGEYETTTTESKVFALTAQRVSGSGELQMIAGGTGNQCFLKVVAEGPAGVVTIQASP